MAGVLKTQLLGTFCGFLTPVRFWSMG